MSVFEGIMMMLAFSTFVLSLLTFILNLIEKMTKK